MIANAFIINTLLGFATPCSEGVLKCLIGLVVNTLLTTLRVILLGSRSLWRCHIIKEHRSFRGDNALGDKIRPSL